MFYFNRMRRHEQLLIGLVLGLVIASIAIHMPSRTGAECITRVISERGELVPGTRRIEAVLYQIHFEGRIQYDNGQAICQVSFKDVACSTHGRSIECRPTLKINQEDPRQ